MLNKDPFIPDVLLVLFVLYIGFLCCWGILHEPDNGTKIDVIEVGEDPALVKINQELADIKCRLSQLENTTEINLSLTTSIESMLQEKKNR